MIRFFAIVVLFLGGALYFLRSNDPVEISDEHVQELKQVSETLKKDPVLVAKLQKQETPKTHGTLPAPAVIDRLLQSNESDLPADIDNVDPQELFSEASSRYQDATSAHQQYKLMSAIARAITNDPSLGDEGTLFFTDLIQKNVHPGSANDPLGSMDFVAAKFFFEIEKDPHQRQEFVRAFLVKFPDDRVKNELMRLHSN